MILARPAGRRGHSSSLISFGRALGLVGFISVRWVHTGAPWVSAGSFGFVGIIWALPWGRRVHSGSLGSYWGSALGSLGFVRFIRALPVDRRVHLDAWV